LKQAPDGSAAKNLGDTLDTVKKPFVNLDIGEQLLGISVKDLKTNFKKAMAKDDQAPATILQPSRFLRKSGRVMSLSLGMALNFTSRLVACAFGVAGSAVVLGALTVAFLYNNFDSTMWKNPREAMLLSIGLGAGFGAGCGAVLGTLGNRLVNSSLGIDTTLKEDFLKSMEHNMAAAVVGSSVGTLTAIANPLCWRAAWVKGDD
jgi:hypothetical protein